MENITKEIDKSITKSESNEKENDNIENTTKQTPEKVKVPKSNEDEELKADFDFVFASSNNEPISGLDPNDSIFGGKNVNTIFIQKIPPQYEEMNFNKYPHINPFANNNPFVKFPNITNKNNCNGPSGHPFFDALYLAYVLHGEIVLSPDDIWLQINSCFAQYVNNSSEQLRHKIVNFQDKKDLIVYYNVNDPAFQDMKSKTFRWDIILKNFSELIRKNTLGGISDLVECNFSTTGAIEKISSQVTLMHVCEKYFNYRMGGKGCGIRKVHFLGEKEDWLNLQKKIIQLKNYSMGSKDYFSQWIDRLNIILDNFLDTYDDEPNPSFWNSIIEQFEGYLFQQRPSKSSYTQATFINGWILDFFLYDKTNNYFSESLIDRPLENPRGKNDSEKVKYKKGASFTSFPVSVWKAPVLIEYCFGPKKGVKIPVNFLAGFTGVLHESENNLFRPQISFAVADREITDEEKSFKPLWKKK